MVSFHYENTPIQIYWKFHLRAETFQIKNSDILHIPARGGSNEYPQSMFFNKKKTMYTPVNPNFTL